MNDQFSSKPQVPLGSEAFGYDQEGRPSGSEAFGGSDAQHPLRGALLFGNDPAGGPRGSESFGGSDDKMPLRGALLFGNDPAGDPRGSELIGGSEAKIPLKGALLFGNDPAGGPRGSEIFGQGAPDELRGAAAVGSGQGMPVRLVKDEIGYDFAGVLLRADETSMAGIRKDARDRDRLRVLRILQRRLAMEPQRLRHGLNEDAVPWGRLRHDSDLDKKLAEELRKLYQRAPGDALGIAHVRDALEKSERMHTFDLSCEWDIRPVNIRVLWRGKAAAYAVSAVHKEFEFLIFKTAEGAILAYTDLLQPHKREQLVRVRNAKGQLLATLELHEPGAGDAYQKSSKGFYATVRDPDERVAFVLKEERAAPNFFRAPLYLPDSEEEAGVIEDALKSGKIRTHVELDVRMPPVVAWSVAALMADLARLRRKGWPDKPVGSEDAPIEPIEEALGPRKRG